MVAALSVYVLSGDLAWVPNGHRQPAMPRLLPIERGRLACQCGITQRVHPLHSP